MNVTDQKTEVVSKRPARNKFLLQLLAILLAIFITIGIALLPIDWRHLDWERIKQYGYAGLFFTALLSDATVLIPFPGLAAVFLAGGFLNPIIVGIITGLGSALGELTGYLAGFGGRAVIEEHANYAKLERWMKQKGTLTIFILSIIPNPLFDMAGIMAGSLKFPLWQFILICWLGKAIKFAVIAFAGAGVIDFIIPFIKPFLNM